MKKKIIIIAAVAVVLLAGAFLLWKLVFSTGTTESGGDENAVPVTSVANITGIGGGISAQTRFSGLVEPQKTLDIKKDADKKVADLYVSEGDTVKAGDKLFKYDTDDISLKLDQTKLEVETISNKIQTLNSQIDDLKKERDKAKESDKLSYTLQIQSLELDIRSEEYKKTTQSNEIAKIEKSLTNAEITSEIDGVIKSVNSTGQMGNDGQELPYLSILSTGNYRIKCTATEFHINSLSQGQQMVVRSRTDPDAMWKGSIESIDRENTVQNNNNNGMVMMGPGGSENNTTASKYNFYVALENFDGLILGQHIFAEIDYGITEKKDGLWLPSYYIVSEDGKSSVWVRNDKEKLEKRQVTLGEQDPESDTYEIKDGLTVSDYIAFPQENLTNGMNTTVGDNMMQGGMIGGGDAAMPEGGMVEGETIPEGGTLPEGEAVPEGESGAADGAVIGSDKGEAIPEGAGQTEQEKAEKAAADQASDAPPPPPQPKTNDAGAAAGAVI